MSELDKVALADRYVEVISAYPEDERPSITTEVVKQVAEEFGIPANSARLHISRDPRGVYIKKDSAKKSASADGEKKTGGTRTSKAAAQAELKAALLDAGAAEDKVAEGEEIIEKMTGKAALFLAELIRSITK
ncbi:hypothetical protein [Providencia phage PSTCR5]|uniref:D3 protein n=1 Tax=Providencia phage PSTCR5 TaxID=2783547 RepID=A0A873WHQ6_9CAUD|nr:DNA binding protein [Providencia phage PSTCR5]QPB12103.1 hypothetical protein [Providencia phage PSTCR5]